MSKIVEELFRIVAWLEEEKTTTESSESVEQHGSGEADIFGGI